VGDDDDVVVLGDRRARQRDELIEHRRAHFDVEHVAVVEHVGVER
jgi:hypothetical protein